MLRRIGVSLVVMILAVGLGQLPAESAGSSPIPFPQNPKGLKAPVALPKALDPPARYLPQVSCSPRDLSGPKKLRDLVLATYKIGRKGNISRGCTEGLSEHSEGRAWDWMVNVTNAKEKAAAGHFLAWLTNNHGANARRLGVMYVIHNKKIWGIYREQEGWRTSSGHTDHIHISFSWNGARANTSFWTGKVQPVDYGPCARFAGQPAVLRSKANLSRCYTPAALVKKNVHATRMYGSRASTVKTAQGLLKVSKTGVFDAATWAAVKAFQQKHDLPWTGTLDVPTWGALTPGAVTTNVAAGYTPASAADYGLANYGSSTTAKYATGKAVLFLQTALAMPTKDRNGYFGSVTVEAVKKFQAARGLDQTGAVTRVEWQALADS